MSFPEQIAQNSRLALETFIKDDFMIFLSAAEKAKYRFTHPEEYLNTEERAFVEKEKVENAAKVEAKEAKVALKLARAQKKAQNATRRAALRIVKKKSVTQSTQAPQLDYEQTFPQQTMKRHDIKCLSAEKKGDRISIIIYDDKALRPQLKGDIKQAGPWSVHSLEPRIRSKKLFKKVGNVLYCQGKTGDILHADLSAELNGSIMAPHHIDSFRSRFSPVIAQMIRNGCRNYEEMIRFAEKQEDPAFFTHLIDNADNLHRIFTALAGESPRNNN